MSNSYGDFTVKRAAGDEDLSAWELYHDDSYVMPLTWQEVRNVCRRRYDAAKLAAGELVLVAVVDKLEAV
jgi:hypothetical protein